MDDERLDAGPFGAWLVATERSIAGEADSDVPCGSCTACCSSSQFVHIGPDEHDALEHIPAPLLFPAPRMPAGHVLLGYDAHGRCPMLRDDGCSIYAHRPRTCRTYDCRVFPAAGIDLGGDADKGLIAARARRWEFGHPDADDAALHDAVRAAAAFVSEHQAELPPDVAPTTPTQLAVAAVVAHREFVERDAGRVTPARPDVRAVAVALGRRRVR
jgi:Fe-S-cluster containining protein